MAKMISELSVFFPAYNEEAHAENTVNKAVKVLGGVAKKWEIIIVEDGSADKTLEIAKKLSANDKRIRVVHHKKNRGYGGAFKSGFYNARYKWIAFTDIDGQFDISEITKFIKEQKATKADLVIGYYKKRQVSKGLFGLKVRDIDCGFKLVRKKVIDSIPKLESERGAFISTEFLVKAKKEGFKIVEIPVTHYPRTAGLGTGRDLSVIFNSFADLFKLWRKLH
jgi:glycosyltransferase involved in cell wall biosynthesis